MLLMEAGRLISGVSCRADPGKSCYIHGLSHTPKQLIECGRHGVFDNSKNHLFFPAKEVSVAAVKAVAFSMGEDQTD